MYTLKSVVVYGLLLYVELICAYKGVEHNYIDRLQHNKMEDCNQLQCRNTRHRYGVIQDDNQVMPESPRSFQDRNILSQALIRDPTQIHEGQTSHDQQNPQDFPLFRDPQVLQELEGNSGVDDGTEKTIREILSDPAGPILGAVGKRTPFSNLNDYESLMAMTGLGSNYPVYNPAEPGTQILSRSDFLNSKRANCACEHTTKVLDLGHSSFPRYYSTLECTPGSCWLEPYSCKKKVYMLWVLKQKEPSDKFDRHAPLVPDALRAAYIFQGVPITVACECAA